MYPLGRPKMVRRTALEDQSEAKERDDCGTAFFVLRDPCSPTAALGRIVPVQRWSSDGAQETNGDEKQNTLLENYYSSQYQELTG